MKRYLLFSLFLIYLSGCLILGQHSDKSRVLYKENIETGEEIKITYSNNSDYKVFRIFLRNNNSLVQHFEISDVPQRFVINKLVMPQKGTKSHYRLVSDTINAKLKCIDFSFLQNENNSAVLSTFIPLTAKEKQIFQIFSKVLAKTDFGIQFSEEELKKIKGWVLVFY